MTVTNIYDAIRLLFRKDKALYRAFYKILGFYPHNISYYQEAVMHKSLAARSEKGKPLNNERLEYLGDAVLESVTSDILFRHFPNKREGFLTNARSKMVQREMLGKVATRIGLDKLIMHHNKQSSHNSYMGGNAFEALIGAIYLDRGYDYCMQFICQRIINNAIDLEKTAYVEINFKSKLMELCQKYHLHIEYALIEETRDAKGAPYFHSSAIIEGEEYGKGEGYSKRESQQKASRIVLQKIKKEPSLLKEIIARAEASCNQPTDTES